MGRDQWVSPRGDKWAVHGAGASKDTKLFTTQAEAIQYAREIAKNQQSELKDSFGNDPCPPKDKEH